MPVLLEEDISVVLLMLNLMMSELLHLEQSVIFMRFSGKKNILCQRQKEVTYNTLLRCKIQ
jgi:hypothetical protein